MCWGARPGCGFEGGTIACTMGQQRPLDPGGPDPRTEVTPKWMSALGPSESAGPGRWPRGGSSREPPASATMAAWKSGSPTGHPDSAAIKDAGSQVLCPWPGGQPVGKCHFRVSWKGPEGKTQPAFACCRVNVPSPPHPSCAAKLDYHGELVPSHPQAPGG